jgi:hypothetical protein
VSTGGKTRTKSRVQPSSSPNSDYLVELHKGEPRGQLSLVQLVAKLPVQDQSPLVHGNIQGLHNLLYN